MLQMQLIVTVISATASLGCYMQVVHMDVKSKNILLDKEYKVAKIADVGLARVLGNTVSTRGLPLGTFHYAAPELLVGDRNLVTEKVFIAFFAM